MYRRCIEDEAFERLRGRVSAAVRRCCPAWLREQAEDIVQDVLVKLLKSLRGSEGEKKFSSLYLEKTAYCSVVDEIRRVCRRKEGPVENEQTVERLRSERAGPERGSESLEIARGIQDCLRQLVGSRRLALTFYLQGCTVPEAARHLRWTTKKTENLVYRGLADLRRCLTGKGLQP